MVMGALTNPSGTCDDSDHPSAMFDDSVHPSARSSLILNSPRAVQPNLHNGTEKGEIRENLESISCNMKTAVFF
jgi:hypothetical protein